jgi:hypothetical protein
MSSGSSEIAFDSLPAELQEERLSRRYAVLKASILKEKMEVKYTDGDLYKVVCYVLTRAQGWLLVSMDAVTIQAFIDEALEQVGKENRND